MSWDSQRIGYKPGVDSEFHVIRVSGVTALPLREQVMKNNREMSISSICRRFRRYLHRKLSF